MISKRILPFTARKRMEFFNGTAVRFTFKKSEKHSVILYLITLIKTVLGNQWKRKSL